LLQDARPWANYESDYRPMVEFSKYHKMPVIAANAPRRYVGAVGRSGASTFANGTWSVAAHTMLPPFPLPKPSASYVCHLMMDPAVLRTDQLGLAPQPSDEDASATMKPSSKLDVEAVTTGKCPFIGLGRRDGLMQPLLLWDATMAHSICSSLASFPGKLVYHVCGSFHCEGRHGIAEMIEAYRPQTKVLVVVVYAEDDCDAFDLERHGSKGDFVLLADARLPRSHEYFDGASE